MNNRASFVILMLICQCTLYGQFGLYLTSPTDVSYCGSVLIEGGIEKTLSNTTSDNIQLQLESSFPVEAISFSPQLELISQEGNSITFAIQNNECGFFQVFVELAPTCNEIPLQVITTAKLIDDTNNCIASQELFFFISYPSIDVDFGEYAYDASTEILSKIVTLTNNSNRTVNEFTIVPRPDRGFATLVNEPNGTTKSNDSLLLNRPINPGGELELLMEFDLEDCELRPVTYDLIFDCQQSSCFSRSRHIDENELLSQSIAASSIESFVYGLCEPNGSELKIFNSDLGIRSSVGAIFNIRVEFRDNFRSRSRVFTDCFDLQATSNNTDISTTIVDDLDHIINFSSITTDPDGAGGFSDLDGDGQFDDLASADSLALFINAVVKEDCYDQYHNSTISQTLTIHYDNFCQLSNTTRSSSDFIGSIDGDSYYQTGIRTPEELIGDANNDFTIADGDTLEFIFRFRPRDAINSACESNKYFWTLDVPPNVRSVEDDEFMVTDEVNEWTLPPLSITGDTLYQFELILDETNLNFLDRYTITKKFTALCIDTVDTTDLLPCEQCIEIPEHRFFSNTVKECDPSCAIPIPNKSDVSAPFRVVCEDEPDLALLIDYEDSEIYNLTEGFSSLSPNINRDVFSAPSSINNRLFFDGDTLLIRIPITINCLDELESFEVSASRGYFPDDSRIVEIIDASVIRIDDQTETCNVFSDLISEATNLFSILFSNADIANCFSETNQFYIDVKAIVDLLNEDGRFRNSSQLSITTRISEENKNSCQRRNNITRADLFLHDVYNPEVFIPGDIFEFGQSGYVLYQTRIKQFPIYESNLSSEIFEPEYKFIPILREISFEVPHGFEIINGFNILKSKTEETGFFSFLDLSLSDTLFTLQEIITENSDSRTYNYTYDGSEYYHSDLKEGVFGSYDLKAICEPVRQRVDINITGKIEYVDYANGTLDTLIHEFEDRLQVAFIEDVYVERDDFQDLTNEDNGLFEIAIRGNSFSFDRVDDFREDLETWYRFEFESSGTIIDSIFLSADEVDQFGNESRVTLPSETFLIDDQIFDVRGLPESSINQLTGDTFSLGTAFPSIFNLHTSNHPCGFDTIFYRAGLAAQFESDSCDAEIIDSGEFIIFSNFGFPNVVFDSIPDFIDLNNPSSFIFSLENIGAAPLDQNVISISNFREDNYALWQLDANGERMTDFTSLSQVNQDTLLLELSEENIGSLMHPGDDRQSSWQFELELLEPCPTDSLFNLSIQSTSKSQCVGDHISQAIATPNIPYVDANQLDYSINAINLSDRACLDTLILLLEFEKLDNSAEDIISSGINIELANDLNILNDGVRFNDQPASNIQSIATGNNTTTIFRIENPDVLSTDARIEIKLNGTCIDQCRKETIRAFLFSEETISCKGTSSEIDQTRGVFVNDDFSWNTGVIIDSVSLEINGIETDSVDINLVTSLSKPTGSLVSNDVIVNLFTDTNNNDISDSGELIQRFMIPNTVFTSDEINMNLSTTVPLEFICSLELAISNDSDCLCTESHLELADEQTLVINSTVDFCGQSMFNVKLLEFPSSCSINQSLEDGITQIDDMTLSVTPAIYTSSTLSIERTCSTCTFIENFEFINSVDNNIQIEISSNSDCIPQAVVRWADGSDIVNPLSVIWNQDPTNRNTILLMPTAGLLSVLVVDSGGCEYTTELSVDEPPGPLSISSIPIVGQCNPQFPITIDLPIVGGVAPYQVEWSDGTTGIARSIIESGKYFLTVTDAVTCTYLDSISISEEIIFTTDVTNPSCLVTNDGSIEIVSSNSDLVFGLTPNDLSPNNTFERLTQGTYTVFVQDENSCLDSTSIELFQNNEYQLNIPDSHTLNSPETIQLNPELENPIDAIWQWTSDDFELSCVNCPNPEISPLLNGAVSLRVQEGDCEFSQIISIAIPVNNSIYFPNAFRISSKQNNNKFRVLPNATFDRLTIRIYDRWGNLMFEEFQDNFEAEDYGWDGYTNGELALEGVYVYRARLERDVDNESVDVVGDFILFH